LIVSNKIALEEHFALPGTLGDSSPFVPADHWPELKSRLLDIHERRLREMDAHGIELMILSLNAPTVQAVAGADSAVELAQRANDFLAEQIVRNPGRFQGFAALPMQDPERASIELRRCMSDLGFRGALVNGFSDGPAAGQQLYYDAPEYRPFWAEAERLGAPFYLHPRNPTAGSLDIYKGQEWLLGPTWAFGQETAVHALRLIGSGLFDEHPGLRVILGHMGEGLPFNLWRIDHRNAWVDGPRGHKASRDIAHYVRENFFITTSGNFSGPALLCAMLVLGAERILFSTDWPFENIDHAASWFDSLDLSDADKIKMGRTNAAGLFRLET
jgi:predicted TIM-barrel fold metal-dependent hydrolase